MSLTLHKKAGTSDAQTPPVTAAVTAPKRPRGAPKPGWQKWVGVSGGRIFIATNGTANYYVERKVAGERVQVNLRTEDPEVALLRLRDWERDPAGWSISDTLQSKAPLLLSLAMVQDYAAWCAEPPLNSDKLYRSSPEWTADKVRALKWWMSKIKNKSLRADESPGSITALDVTVALRQATSVVDYRHKLEALKHLYTFLRTGVKTTEWAVKRHHDPTQETPLPGHKPQQHKKSKVAWTRDDCLTVIAWLEQQQVTTGKTISGKPDVPDQVFFTTPEAAAVLGTTINAVGLYIRRGVIKADGGGKRGRGAGYLIRREALVHYIENRGSTLPKRVALALRILAGTAWHVSEVARFSKDGIVKELPEEYVRQHGAAKCLEVLHKRGHDHPQAVTLEVAQAAEELVRLGGVSDDNVTKWTKKAVDATKVNKFSPGQFRHRISTFQTHQGADQKDIGKAIGHESERTTRIYTELAVPPKQATWL